MKLLFIILIILSAQSQDKRFQHRQKNLITNGEIHANNVKAIVANNGWLFWGGGASGFITPSPIFSDNDANFASVFASGIWVSGKINNEYRAAISLFATDFVPGNWDEYKTDSIAFGPDNPKYRVYYHYSDEHIVYLESLLNDYESTETNKVLDFARSELEKAQSSNLIWQEAINQGAPAYPPGDIAAFTIYHDADVDHRERNGYNESKTPMNLQIRQLSYSFRAKNALNNTVFVKYDIINKNDVPINELRVSLFSDIDIGNYQDDFLGSDRELEISYGYNANEIDAQYSEILNMHPPATAYNFVQGFLIDSIGKNVISRGSNFDFLSNESDKNQALLDDKILNNKILSSALGFYVSHGSAYTALAYSYEQQSRYHKGGYSGYQTNHLNENPNTDSLALNWLFNGDPESNSGWLNQNAYKQILLYNMNPIDLGVTNGLEGYDNPAFNSFTIAVTNSFGGSNLNSVTRAKYDAKIVDFEFQNAFRGFKKPKAPKVYAYGEDQKISLHWEEQYDTKTNHTTESFEQYSYKFQGYEIAEFASNGEFKTIQIIDLKDGIKHFRNVVQDSITNFSVINHIGKGLNNGINHQLEITKSLFTLDTLYNNNEYQFAVRALYYNPKPFDDATNVIFSDWAKTKVSPKKIGLGSELISERMSSVDYEHTGVYKTDGKAIITVIDPYLTTNKAYSIRFKKTKERIYHFAYSHYEDRDSDGRPEIYLDTIPSNTIVWYLEKEGQVLPISVNGEMSSDWVFPQAVSAEEYNYNLYIDGLRIAVTAPPPEFRNFTVTSNANGELDPPEMAAFAFNGHDFPLVNGADRPDSLRQQSNGSTWGIHISNDWTAGNSFAAFIDDIGYYMGGINGPLVAGGASGTGIHYAIPNDYEIRFTAAGSKAVLRDANTTNRHMVDVPFELWNTGPVPSDTSDDYRMVPFIRDRDGDLKYSFSSDDHSVSGGTNDPVLEGITFLDPTNKTPGQAGYDALVAAATADLAANGNMDASITAFPYAYNSTYHTVGFNYIGLVNWNGGDVGDAAFPANVDAFMPEEGTIFRISMNKINTENTVMEFKGPGAPILNNPDLASQDFAKNLTVFPNPLYGFNPQGSGSDLYVTFANLPVIENKDKVTIDIFTMNGDVINRLVYDGQSTEFRWDLKNKYGTQVGNGLFIASLTYRGKNVIKKILIFKGKQR